MSVTNTVLDSMPGEEYFTLALQRSITFTIGKKIIKQGRLIIFKRSHYYIQITILNNKNVKETFEIPIPFKTEYYQHENLIFFDYRIRSLAGADTETYTKLQNYRVKNVNPSNYYNKILEIQTKQT